MQGLTSVPPAVFAAKNLRTLALSANEIDELPLAIGGLKKLQHLILDRNPLLALPDAIGRLESLQRLRAAETHLKVLPRSVGTLRSLRSLELPNTPLAALPTAIGKCTKLRVIDLARTRITKLPRGLGGLQDLERVDLSSTPITAIPGALAKTPLHTLIVRDTRQLDVLSLRRFRRSGLRKLQLAGPLSQAQLEIVAQLDGLEKLSMVAAGLRTLPQSFECLTRLKTLQLDQNRFKRIPPVVRRMPALKKLVLWSNPLKASSVDQFRAENPELVVKWSA